MDSFPNMKTIAGAIAAFVFIAFLQVSPAEESTRSTPTGKVLILHYRWRKDSLSLVDKEWVRASMKPSRSRSARKRLGMIPGPDAPRSGFSYELVSSQDISSEPHYLPEPGLQRVEFQEPGAHQMRQEERLVDTADIFIRVPEAEAKSIRFYRHGPGEGASRNPAAVADTDADAGAEGKPLGKTTAIRQGPEPAFSKTLLAEFPLE